MSPPSRRRVRLAATATAVLLALLAPALPASAAGTPAPPAPPAATATARPAHPGLDRKALDRTLQDLHKAGMYGAYSAVRDGDASWQGASGVADIKTGRPMRPQFEHRIGSITKTFTATAVLQQVGEGTIDLDAPIGRYLPDVVPGERGRAITVRMLLNHTSGLGDYDTEIWKTPDDVVRMRYRQWDPRELVRLGLEAPPQGKPGEAHHYANTNYVIAGLLLRKVTGQAPEKYITDHVIRKAGLKHTYFPRSAHVTGPHAKIYEGLYGLFDPPRDFTVHNMSWARTAGALISTMDDLNQFFRALLTGKLLDPAELRQMKTTVPTEVGARYGLGLFSVDSTCGRFWGHDGLVWGASTISLSSEDGRRQLSLGVNLTRYYGLGEDGLPKTGPIDTAQQAHMGQALCGISPTRDAAPRVSPFRDPESIRVPAAAR
ncbi:serine hydrolase [Streptomyces rimosus]|uniref:serine hydrolase domain-containing protein n=1 Tax=Streptomyces rimosus TaxID=1927 RepID=UPI00227737EC|nr:serine hydrolase domain-containing protein [Streptomyces rimosus]